MYCLNKLCCICLRYKGDLILLSDVNSDGVSHYVKLTSSIAEMDFEEMNDQRLICEGCCVTLNTVYDFRQTCLRSKANLITYISQLRTYSPVRGTLSVRLRDIKHELKHVKEEIYIKCEKEDSRYFDHENIFVSASIKEECESEEDGNFTYEDNIVDQLNERGRGDVKIEDIGHQTTIKDEYTENYTQDSIAIEENIKADIQEHLLDAVKNEHMTETLPAQDGSTSHTYMIPETVIKQSIENSGEKTAENFVHNENPSQHVKHTDERTYSSESYNDKPYISNQVCEKSFDCDICKKTYSQRSALNLHMRIHSGERPYECEICKKTFIQKTNLTVHRRTHSGERPFECEICKETFVHRSSYSSHITKTHSVGVTFECEICKKKYPHSWNLNQHMLTHTGERPYQCEICKKMFFQRGALNLHVKIHSGERPYECEICKKTFVQKANLTAHKRTHSGETPYECEMCKETFVHRSSYTSHITKMHSVGRTYECEICKKKYPHNWNLTQHMLTHSGERPYECEICKKTFPQKSALNVHMRTHSGEKPYSCEICMKKFRQKGTLKSHMRVHTGERPYECELCDRKFLEKGTLKKHKQNIHEKSLK